MKENTHPRAETISQLRSTLTEARERAGRRIRLFLYLEGLHWLQEMEHARSPARFRALLESKDFKDYKRKLTSSLQSKKKPVSSSRQGSPDLEGEPSPWPAHQAGEGAST